MSLIACLQLPVSKSQTGWTSSLIHRSSPYHVMSDSTEYLPMSTPLFRTSVTDLPIKSSSRRCSLFIGSVMSISILSNFGLDRSKSALTSSWKRGNSSTLSTLNKLHSFSRFFAILNGFIIVFEKVLIFFEVPKKQPYALSLKHWTKSTCFPRAS